MPKLLTSALALTALAGCGSAAAAVSLTRLPLGDGHVGSSPRAGYVDSCQTSFNPNGPGAATAGPWIDSANRTWNATTKIHVGGSVSWAGASYRNTVSGSKRTIHTKSLPVGLTTGIFPVAASDPAAAYDRNPNAIAAQSLTITMPSKPRRAASPACLSLGAIGVLSDGVALFNALDAQGRDAAAHEVLDRCDGHPQMRGMYHHHTVGACVLAKAKGRSALVGYALDGFGIYVERDSAGRLLTNAGLDACHGRTSTVRFNGRRQRIYHYVATREYPYTLGCYRGRG
jgi:hypothetical protein